MVRDWRIWVSVCAACVALAAPAAAGGARAFSDEVRVKQALPELSSQNRREVRRASTRITVRPERGPLRRECVPVFEERWIPQWGGSVLYAGQNCWWTRAPI